MNQLDKKEMIPYLDASTMKALLKIYNLKYSHIAGRLGFTKQNLVYLLKHDRFTESQRYIVLEILFQYGLEPTELVLINSMCKKVNQL